VATGRPVRKSDLPALARPDVYEFLKKNYLQ